MEPLFLIHLCLLGAVLAAFLMAGRMRLASLASLYAIQAVSLSAAAALFAIAHGDALGYVVAGLTFVLKALLIPYWFVRIVRAHGSSERLMAFVRPTMLSFAAFIAIIFSGFVAQTLALTPGASYVGLAASIALILTGFLMLITRRDMVGLGFGFLVVENGVFTLGLALTGGLPLFIELGVLFDLSIFFLLLIAFARRAQREHASLATDYLHELIG